MELDTHKLLVGNGPSCDTENFAEYIQKNMKLYELNNDLSLGTSATANFIRREVSSLLYVCVYYNTFLYHYLLLYSHT